MDYSKLKNAALQAAETEEAVTVDTRALIDKVLARYSGEWTTLRELIQNAADAQATTITIKWETLPSVKISFPPPTATPSEVLQHTVAHHTIRRLVVQNNGQAFTQTDWARIKRIAEGNPDETKIGAFGVGFYSVFADCEEPFISSGNEAMAFYWKGNALFTKKSKLPDGHASDYTTFVLDYRNSTMALPSLLSVCQFLATSLTFVALQKIEFKIDDWLILSLSKTTSPSTEIAIPRDLNRRTTMKLMTVSHLHRSTIHIDAAFMSVVGWEKPPTPTPSQAEASAPVERSSLRSFFRKLQSAASQPIIRTRAQNEAAAVQSAISQDVSRIYNSDITLSVSTASIQVDVDKDFAAELERATKKPPPKTTRISILTSSYHSDTEPVKESTSPSKYASKVADLFATVLPSAKPGGRIFIGFPTMQTSGAGIHISAPSVIPTVEREAIDLNARYVRLWNVELLRAAGIMARLTFSHEMEELSREMMRSLPAGGKLTPDITAGFLPEASHILSTFSFGESTPSGQVVQIIEESFWTCFNKASIEMFSNMGVLPTTKVRIAFEGLSDFAANIPIVPKQLENHLFVIKLKDFSLICNVTNTDLRLDLEAGPLTQTQMIHFLKWIGKHISSGELTTAERDMLLRVAVCTLGDGTQSGQIVALAAVKHFLNPSRIPPTMTIPPDTIPPVLTNGIPEKDLKGLGWDSLDVARWLEFIVDERGTGQMTESPQFALSVLIVLSRQWDSMSAPSRFATAALLADKAVMPTKLGLRLPTESFFPSVKLFDDLPVIQVNLKESMLVALGVRKTLDLETIFQRLLKASGETGEAKWSHVELIRYLASVKHDIPKEDLQRLKRSKLCPRELDDQFKTEKAADEMPQAEDKTLYRVDELMEPRPELRELGLPLIKWPGGNLRSGTPELQFLIELGLRKHPDINLLLEFMTLPDPSRRKRARDYYIVNFSTFSPRGKSPVADTQLAIMPLDGDSKRLVPPARCFTNEKASIMGFDILHPDLRLQANLFGIATDPPIKDCVQWLLQNPPRDQTTARMVFEYMDTRSGYDAETLGRLQEADFIPVFRKSSSAKDAQIVIHLSPKRCYLGLSTAYGDIFDFVDFGQNANTFLRRCGVKSDPTKTEIAETICREPAKLLETLQTPERYLSLLKTLAADVTGLTTIKKNKVLWGKMRMAPMCLGYVEVSVPNSKLAIADDEDEQTPIKVCRLMPAADIVVKDDIVGYNIFRKDMACAPEDEPLEEFYVALGARMLSSLIREEVIFGAQVVNTDLVTQFFNRVIERSKIFLHQYTRYASDIKHDAKWLESNLEVQLVKSLSLRRTFRQERDETRRSAASLFQTPKSVLYLSNDQSSRGKIDMFEVGQALCHLLLSRPSLHAYTTFEPILTLNLFELRSRGYNVSRILQKREQARMAEEEERRRALQEEQRRIQKEQALWDTKRAAEAAKATPVSTQPSLPAPPAEAAANIPGSLESPRKKRDFLTDMSRRLGFDAYNDKNANAGARDVVQSAPEAGGTSRSGGSRDPNSRDRPAADDGTVTSPAVVQRNLLNAIGAMRAHNSNTLFSEPHVDEVKEKATYCDSARGQDLVFAAEAANGMRIFVPRTTPADMRDALLAGHAAALSAFADLLADIGAVYALPRAVLHLFHDQTGHVIAFNLKGSVFCNLRYFVQLHVPADGGPLVGEARAAAAVWWWVVLAHELAHNLEQSHNADHSYYTESFIQQYFAKVTAKTAEWAAAGRPDPPPYRAR